MVKIFAIIRADSHSFDEMHAKVESLVAYSRTENGCIKYKSFFDRKSHTFFFDEEWAEPELLEAHTKSAPFLAFVEYLMEHDLEVQLHEIEEV